MHLMQVSEHEHDAMFWQFNSHKEYVNEKILQSNSNLIQLNKARINIYNNINTTIPDTL